jgi:hypothetical protein
VLYVGSGRLIRGRYDMATCTNSPIDGGGVPGPTDGRGTVEVEHEP